MAVNLSPVGGVAAQFFTNTGAVLTGGKLYTYLAGTTTPTTTYTTSAGNVARTNPIVLDAAGRVPGSGEIWLTVGITYKFVLTDSNDVLIGTYDNVSSSFNTDASLVVYTPAGAGAVATTVQAKLRQTVSVQDFGAIGNGVANDTAAWNLAIAYCTANNLCLHAPSVSAYYNITSNITITCAFSAGLYRVFGGGGTIKFGPILNCVYPEWWGANKDTDSSAAINAAIRSFSLQHWPDPLSSKLVVFSQLYYVTSTVTLPSLISGLTLQGTGNQASGLNVAHNGDGITGDTSSQETTFRNFRISTASPTTSTGNGIVFTPYDAGSFLGWFICDQVWIEGFRAGTAFKAWQTVYSFFNNIYFRDCKIGMHLIDLNYFGKVQNAQFECSDIGFLTDGTNDFRSWTFDSVNPQGYYRLPEGQVIRMNYGFYFNQNCADISFRNCWFEGVLEAGIQTDISKNHSNFLIEQMRFADALCDYGFLLNNMITAVIQTNNFSNITAEVYVYNSDNVFVSNNIHVNADQAKWFVDNGPGVTYNVFQPSVSATTRSNDTVFYVPTYYYPAGLKFLTSGGGGSGSLAAYAQFGDGSGYKLRWRNSANTTLYDMYDTGNFQIAVAGKGVIMTNAAGTVTKLVRLNDAGNGLLFETP